MTHKNLYKNNKKLPIRINKEPLEIYDLDGNFLKIQARKEFFDEAKKEYFEKGKVSKQVKRVLLLLMTSNGKIVIQKRNKHKYDNAGLFDKTLGGHVIAEDTNNLTLIKESAEELGFPASIVSSEEFPNIIKKTDLRIVGIFKKIETIDKFPSVRITPKGEFVQPYINTTYVGYYDGPIQFIDGETSGIEVFMLDELKQELKKYPERFTEDLKILIKKYEKYLKPIK
jgi:isopentenyldiphosphate isomerase